MGRRIGKASGQHGQICAKSQEKRGAGPIAGGVGNGAGMAVGSVFPGLCAINRLLVY